MVKRKPANPKKTRIQLIRNNKADPKLLFFKNLGKVIEA